MVQKYFINSWLLPCSLRSHSTAHPKPKNGCAIFRLCPPTTQIQALSASGGHVAQQMNKTKKYEE